MENVSFLYIDERDDILPIFDIVPLGDLKSTLFILQLKCSVQRNRL